MTIDSIHLAIPHQSPLGHLSGREIEMRPDLRLVSDGERDTSEQLLEQYFEARSHADLAEKPDGEELAAIQREVGTWLTTEGPLKDATVPTYEQYAGQDMPTLRGRYAELIEHLRSKIPEEISEEELRTTELFLSSADSMNRAIPEDGSVHPDADGSFAFVVPARMSRKNVEYGQEVEQVIPALRYVPRELRSTMMVGLPPFIIDRYKPGPDGKRGYLVFAPVYPDMKDDLSAAELRKAGRKQVDDAVNFAYGRLGTKVVGLGAMLPSVTLYGRTITNPNVITTTGHGGTVHLIFETIRRAEHEGRVPEDTTRSIGVLGLGAIGGSIARIARAEYPDSGMTVYDIREDVAHKIAREIGATIAVSEAEVISNSDVIISALPDVRLSLGELGLGRADMKGRLIVDDSQPAAFSAEEVNDLEATLSWVVGQDGDSILRSDYTYGDTLAEPNDLFGCEAEAAAIAMYRTELIQQGVSTEMADRFTRKFAIREAVTPDMVRMIGHLFDRYGISAAPLQAFGKHV
jgi:hypothetical protein